MAGGYPFRTGPRPLPPKRAEAKSLRWAPLGFSRGDPYLKPAEIERRKDAREAERATHEGYWLRVEQEKYGLSKRGRAISGMPV